MCMQGIAKTGSGKTAAFILPMIVHIMDQPELAKGEGPIALIAAPTRELAEQIHREARKLARPYQLRICAAFGGLPKQQQFKELRAGAEVAVCTPGRMIDLIKMKACTTRRVTYLVFDEADRMFDLGFEPQVRSLMGQVRPDRQTLLFSATMPRKMERLAAEALTAPVRITVGTAGGANEDVRQVVEVVGDDGAKMQWLSSRLAALVDDGDVLVFANQKARVDALSSALEALGVARVAAIHGDMDQASRMEVLGAFKAGQVHVLVATDVAARGLDIKSIKTVVNYDAAKDIETHVHRVGRTGRAGDKEGVAYTLLLPTETKAAADLVRCLAAAGQDAPHAVHEMAMRDSKFKRGEGRGKGKRGAQGRPKGPQVGGSGLGFGPSGNGGGSAAPAAQTGSYASGLAGFAPSHDGADAHFLTAARPTPPGQLAARVPPPTVAPPAQAVPAATPVPSPPPGFAAQAAAAPPLPQPPQKGPQAEYIEARHAAVGQQFKSSFVSSGLRQGDVDAKPQIVLPKSSTIRQGAQAPGARAPPPPPVPVTQMPLYLQQRPQFGRGRGSGGGPPAPVAPMVHGGGGASVPSGLQQGPAGGPSAAAVQSDSVQRAIAQARAIAERLAAKGGGGGGGGQGSQWKWGGG